MVTTALRTSRARGKPAAVPLLKRGALAGLGGGAAMAGFLLLAGEPSIRKALAIEAAQHGGEEAEEMFSRPVQVVGGVTAAILYGVFIGTIFAVAFAVSRRRARLASDFRLALGLGVVGFLALVLVPGLKYPANPPAVGDPETIGERTAAYLTLVAASLLLAGLAWRAWTHLRDRGVPEEARAAAVAGGWCAAVGLAFLLWPPTPDAVSVPAQLLWRFRMASMGGALLSWLTTASLFGWLTARSARHRCSTL